MKINVFKMKKTTHESYFPTYPVVHQTFLTLHLVEHSCHLLWLRGGGFLGTPIYGRDIY